jgi:hypothetical protein
MAATTIRNRIGTPWKRNNAARAFARRRGHEGEGVMAGANMGPVAVKVL